MKCIGCGKKITMENTGVLLNRSLPPLCFNCKRECLFAGLLDITSRR